jgi:pheromone shutdown-related protein TraB
MIKKISDNKLIIKRKNPFTNEKQEIYLLGTAHVSKESVEDVKTVIDEFKPDVVSLELCKQRYKKLIFKDQWLNTDIFQVIKNKEHLLFLLNILLSSYQKSIGEELGVMPGSEFLEADKIAKEKNIRVELVDRDIGITLKRAFEKISIWHKTKLLLSIIMGFLSTKPKKEMIEELKKEDMLNKALDEFARFSPKLKEVLVDERNVYLANKTLEINSNKILLVIGAGHLKEIGKILETQDKAKSLKHLELIKKKKKRAFSIINWTILILFVGLIAYGFLGKGITVGLNMILWWIVATGGLAALGALIGGASILGIIVSFLVAPITTVHPLFAAGWFAGLVELKKQKPKLKDFYNLREIRGLKDFRKNNVLRILIIVALTNVGATLGTLVGFPLLLAYIL